VPILFLILINLYHKVFYI